MIHVSIPMFKYSNNTILEQIHAEFESGCTHGIIGLNGAGKTTFFKILSGIIKAEGCEVTFGEEKMSRKMISHIDTDPFFYKHLTAREFLSVFDAVNPSYDEDALCRILKLVPDQLIEEYSTGMKKKLLLLSQIKQDKSIFILDEPFNGLDLETNKILEVIIRSLNAKGKTVFISSHILEPLLHVCHNISYIKNNRFERKFKPDEYPQIENLLFGEYTQLVKDELEKIL